MTRYEPSMITGDSASQALATGFPVGKRFASAPVVRVADANPVHLGHHHRADGRWRIYAFAEMGTADARDLRAWARWLTEDPNSPIVRHTPEGRDIDSIFDVKAIFRHPYADIELDTLPSILRPPTGPLGLIDYEKVYTVDSRIDIFGERGIDDAGAVVVVRPDQYVASVLALDATDELAEFFGSVMYVRSGSTVQAGSR